MKRGWQAAVAVLLLVFAFFAFESLRLSLRDALGPGPGFFPFWLSLVGAALTVAILVEPVQSRRPQIQPAEWLSGCHGVIQADEHLGDSTGKLRADVHCRNGIDRTSCPDHGGDAAALNWRRYVSMGLVFLRVCVRNA